MMTTRRFVFCLTATLLALSWSLPVLASQSPRQACRSDFVKYCSDVQRTRKAAAACLRANRAKLSAQCKSALKRALRDKKG